MELDLVDFTKTFNDSYIFFTKKKLIELESFRKKYLYAMLFTFGVMLINLTIFIYYRIMGMPLFENAVDIFTLPISLFSQAMLYFLWILFRYKMSDKIIKTKILLLFKYFFPANNLQYEDSIVEEFQKPFAKKEKLAVFDLLALFFPKGLRVFKRGAFSGKYGNRAFTISAIGSATSYQGRPNLNTTVFKGIVIEINFKASKDEQLILMRKGGKVPADIKFSKLEISELRKYLDCYGKDLNTVNKLLPPDMLTNIMIIGLVVSLRKAFSLDLTRGIPDDLLASLLDDCINVAIPQLAWTTNGLYIFIHHDSPFEVNLNLFKRIDKNSIQRPLFDIFLNLSLILKLIETLDIERPI